VSTTPGNPGNLLEFKNLPGNPGICMVLLEIFVQNVDDQLNWFPVMIKLDTGSLI